jgi:two-component system response regulator
VINDPSKIILLVEDNPDDVALSLRAFKRSHLLNPISVARDGVELDYFLLARGSHTDRAGGPLPTLVILDLKLPKLDGLGVLKALRADQGTRFLPVVILTSRPSRNGTSFPATRWGPTATCASRSTSRSSSKR